MRLPAAIGTAAMLAFAPSLRAQEMKCPQVFMNEAETTVCQSEELLALDRQMSELYRAAKSATPNIARDQKAWARERKKCKSDTACIESLYHLRIEQFQSRLRALLDSSSVSPPILNDVPDSARAQDPSFGPTEEKSVADGEITAAPPAAGEIGVATPPSQREPPSQRDKSSRLSVRPVNSQRDAVADSARKSGEGSQDGSLVNGAYVWAVMFVYPIFVWLSWKYAHLVFSAQQLWAMSPATLFIQRVVAAVIVPLVMAPVSIVVIKVVIERIFGAD